MGLGTKISFGAVTGLAALVAAACGGKDHVGPVITPAQEAAVTPPAAVEQAPHDLTPEAYGLAPTSGSAMVTDYLDSTELNVLKLGSLNQVLKEAQTMGGNSWSYNYILIGDTLNVVDLHRVDKLISLVSGRGRVIPKPGYVIVGFEEPSQITLEEVTNAVYGVGSDKVAVALGYELPPNLGFKPSSSTMYVTQK